jgi:TRAP-type C4-dicarboxylate transport system permease small subunit
MATEKQLLKLEKIKRVVKTTENKKIPGALARGREGYERSIRSVMKVGEWAVLTSIFGVAAAVIFLMVRYYTVYGGPQSNEILLCAMTIIFGIVSGVFGYKLWSLEVTPLFAVVGLVVILFYNALLCIGVLPLVVVVLDIIALTRFSTFCSWFRGIK